MSPLFIKRLCCCCALLFMVSGCGLFKSEPTITPLIPSTVIVVPEKSDNLIFNDCPLERPEGMPEESTPNIKCATLTVPEDRHELDGPKIQLAVAIVKTKSTEPKPDPVLVLVGNPGYGLYLTYSLPYIFPNIFEQRDMIVVDQRGTGSSEPSFDCPEIDTLATEVITNLTRQEFNERLIEESRTCAGQLEVARVNLSAYTTTAEAADLEDLRQALEISQWNIYSIFNGSRLALTMMRDYPQGIRSVILDSPVPLQANPVVDLGTNVALAFDNLFTSCAEDVQCLKAYPDFKETFYALLDQLEGEPILVDVSDRSSGERYQVKLDNERMITFIMEILSEVNDPEGLCEVPRMVYQLRGGKTEAAARLLGRYSNNYFPSPINDWLNCNEELSFNTMGQVTNANQEIGLYLQDYINIEAKSSFSICEAWKAPGVDPIENMPVTSSIPALLLAGEFDWIQPPAYAESTAQTLRNSTAVAFPNTGQLVSFSTLWTSCARIIVDAFLETPAAKPDTICTSKPPNVTWITIP